MPKTIPSDLINNELLIAGEGQTVWLLKEDKTEEEWFNYITTIKLKPGMTIPRFDEFFREKKK